MSFMNFFVEGVPKAQPRPRACIRGKHASVYDAGTADGWKWLVGRAVKEQAKLEDWRKSAKPIFLKIMFALPRPKKHYYQSKSRKGELRDDAPYYHTAKPDLDNYVKAVMDAISDCGAIWQDDSQVVCMRAEKHYVNPVDVGAFITVSERE